MTQFLAFIDDRLGRLFQRIKNSTYVSTNELAFFRILYGALILFYFMPSWSYLKDVPPAFFNPKLLSFANLTNDFLPDILYITSDAIAVILILCITLGIYTRISLIFMFIISSILFSYAASLGKIDHYASLFLFTYPILALTNSGTKYALLKDKTISIDIQNRALGFFGIIIVFGFFTGGFAKCLFWIDFNINTSGFFDWFYGGYFNENNNFLLAKYVFKIPPIFFEIADHLIPIFEISGIIFLLKSKKWWIIFLTTSSFFHLTNLLLLNLGFSLNVLSYGIFIICPILPYIYNTGKRFLNKYYKLFIAICITVTLVRLIIILSQIETFNFHSYGNYYVVEYTVDIFLWILTILSGIFILKKRLAIASRFI